MSLLRKPAILAAITGLLLGVAGGGTANAKVGDVGVVSDVAVVVGTGTIAPGLPSCFPDVEFAGTLALAGDETELGAVEFAGASNICETAVDGHGAGNVAGSVNGVIVYSRVGSIVTLAGNVAINGEQHILLSAVCLFVPTSVNPISTFSLMCATGLES